MFRLLSKETNIFSIPVYIFFLFLMVISFNILDFKALGVFSALITFCGIALGYFLFNTTALNHNTHIPLFLYTFFVFALYPNSLDVGIAMSLFTNSFVLALLTNSNENIRQNAFLAIGTLLAINYLFLPTAWPLFLFVLIHLFFTSNNIPLNLFRYFFGMAMVFGTYFGVAYLLELHAFDARYLPKVEPSFMKDFFPLYYLSPVFLLLLYAIADHYANFNKKSPASKFKYSFLLLFFTSQLVTVMLYMGKNYEYLLVLVLPVVIILARALRFMKTYWAKEVSLWIIVISLVLFRISSFINLSLL